MASETPRAVSSRLLSMKFMQRAAASVSPDSESHSSKKRKLGHSPSTGRIDLNIDQSTIQAAINEQEAQRQAALAQHVSADTHWVLDTKWTGPSKTAKAPLNIVYVGYGDVDSSGDDVDEPAQGRTSTRKVRIPKPKKEAKKKDTGDSDNSDAEESGSSGDESPSRKRRSMNGSSRSASEHARSRSQSRTRNTAESSKAKEFRDKRKKKEVKLNKLTSISGSGEVSGSPSSSGMTCYKCHQPGHKAMSCPNADNSRGSAKKASKGH